MHCKWGSAEDIHSNSFAVNHVLIRLAHSAVSPEVVCACAAGVCHSWSHVFGPEPARWQLPFCVVITWGWRFHQETRACTTSVTTITCTSTNNRVHIYMHTRKKHTSEPRANVYNYPPDTASQSAFSCWLTPDQLACLCAHAQIKRIYMQHTFTIQYVRNYTNSHLLLRSYEHMRVRTHKYRDK